MAIAFTLLNSRIHGDTLAVTNSFAKTAPAGIQETEKEN